MGVDFSPSEREAAAAIAAQLEQLGIDAASEACTMAMRMLVGRYLAVGWDVDDACDRGCAFGEAIIVALARMRQRDTVH